MSRPARIPLEQNFPAPGGAHVREAAQRPAEAFDPLRILVFGSYARGQARPGSDLDLFVVLSEETLAALAGKREAAIAMRRVLRGVKGSIGVIVTTPEEVAKRRDSIWHIVGSAVREGATVYERPSAS